MTIFEYVENGDLNNYLVSCTLLSLKTDLKKQQSIPYLVVYVRISVQGIIVLNSK